MKQVDPKKVLFGAHLGEHGLEPEKLVEQIDRLCIARGMNFVTIRTPKRTPLDPQYLVDWAKYCADHKIYFIYLYTLQHAPEGQQSRYTPEIVQKIKEVAGEYFLGDMLGELGSVWVGKLPGYYINGHPPMLPQNAPDMEEAKARFIRAVQNYVNIDRSLGIDNISVVESSFVMPYNLEAGVDMPFTELMGRDPEHNIASIRGTSRAYGVERWGAYFAHEWYAGRFHDDMLKRKRLFLEWRLAYMQGAGVLCHESGDQVIKAHGRFFDYDSEVVTECRNFIGEFGNYLNEDDRPDGQPIAKFAFIQGNLDSCRGSGAGRFIWGQFEGEEWAANTPEWSWKLLDLVNRKQRWSDPRAYECEGMDATGQMPYGLYDIIPAATPAEVMCKYDTIVFTGWNTMTEELMQKLETFVENGGTLLISAAHLNSSAKRNGEYIPIRGGDVSKLCGVKLTGERQKFNYGMKFRADSIIDGMRYPSSKNTLGDPGFSDGYSEYAISEVTTGALMSTIEDSFHYLDQPGVPAVVENKLGKGHVITTLHSCYPGHNSVYALYAMLTQQLMRKGVIKARVRAIGPDTLRYTVYENGDVYLLNTDYDTAYDAKLVIDGKITEVVHLEPMELKHLKTGLDLSEI